MKAALSQTIFCNLQISSRPPTTGELDKDLDSNGWPQSGRKAALRELRRGFMIHLAVDPHLASASIMGLRIRRCMLVAMFAFDCKSYQRSGTRTIPL